MTVVYAKLADLINASELLSLVTLAGYALFKIMRVYAGKLSMWYPRWMAPRLFEILVLILSISELTLAGIPLCGDSVHSLLLPARALLICIFIVVTVYAMCSIWQTGDCGCDGAARIQPAMNRWRQIWLVAARNIVLFGMAFLAIGTTSLRLSVRWSGAGAITLAENAQIAFAEVLVIWLGLWARSKWQPWLEN